MIGNTQGTWNDISNTDGGISKIFLLETNHLINSLSNYVYLGQYQGHSYFRSTFNVNTWTDARDRANQDGGYLVTITSQNEQDLINSWLTGQTPFIGLYQDVNDPNYSEPSGGWKWVNSNSGTAIGGGTDYTLASSTITIPAGQTTGTTTVTAVQDVLVEGNETVVLDIIGVTNGLENGTQQQTITIIDDDSNNPPTIGNQTFSIQEKSANGTEVGTIVASDPDNNPLAFTITGGSGESTFAVEESTGKLTVKDNTKLDAAMYASLKLTVKVSDGYSDSSAEMIINITSKVLAIEEVASQIFNVYPIPASRKLKVVLKDNVEVERIEFIDYAGKLITPKSSKRKDNTLTLDVSNLYSGIYILNIVTEKGRSRSRIIIE